jgi:hypothetical protein
MPHYRTMLTSDNLCAADLWVEEKGAYREIVVEIDHVKRGEVVGEKGRKKGMPFAHLKAPSTGRALSKPLGLNATNCRTLTSIAGSPDVAKWKGMLITLFVTKTEVGRETVDAIRIRPEAAQPPAKGERDMKPDNMTAPAELSEADRKAIELAEADEAKRG